jgi:hypothetical protein
MYVVSTFESTICIVLLVGKEQLWVESAPTIFKLLMSKVWLLLKSMIGGLYILCFWNVITICIPWHNMKIILLIK